MARKILYGGTKHTVLFLPWQTWNHSNWGWGGLSTAWLLWSWLWGMVRWQMLCDGWVTGCSEPVDRDVACIEFVLLVVTNVVDVERSYSCCCRLRVAIAIKGQMRQLRCWCSFIRNCNGQLSLIANAWMVVRLLGNCNKTKMMGTMVCFCAIIF